MIFQLLSFMVKTINVYYIFNYTFLCAKKTTTNVNNKRDTIIHYYKSTTGKLHESGLIDSGMCLYRISIHNDTILV